MAGDRVPDATELRLVVARAAGGVETGETRLFDVFGPIYHAVLVFTPDVASTDALDVLRRYPKDVIRPLIILPQGAEMITGTQATGGTWRRRER
ncbi:hypothetical protein L210DRAFT_1022348 [Boletus edulis BED1]|uniref:Uncharacterized protein n=1 Tax=Boletus edulis BED1 TaxID=1328754 RepID=A0AAD4BWS2_BOLED|nr:hypothetical protein L210DRAFT_1022348 [Boletus edulis BED1]